MKTLLIFGGLIGALLLAPGAFAADGDECTTTVDAVAMDLPSKGSWLPQACVLLCDGKAAGDAGANACTEWDFADVPGMPDLVIFEYEELAGEACNATPDLTLTTGPVTGGTPGYDLDSSAVVLNSTTNRVIVDISQAPLDRFLFVALADAAGCAAGDVDVRMTFFGRKKGLF
jgi:hypothetical protein